MLKRLAVTAFILCFAVVVSAAEAPRKEPLQVPDYTGIWRGDCMFSSVEAHVYQKGNKIRGVAVVSSWLEENNYHFKGKITKDGFSAAHLSGHRFMGKILSEDEVTGILITGGKGYELELTATRVSRVPTKK